MGRLTNVLLFLILLALTIVTSGVGVITAVSAWDYTQRMCY
jgi:hypothetical protein